MNIKYNREQDNTIGSRIRTCRKKMGYSQETLAAMLYMKKSTISAYENNVNDIPGRVLVRLAEALDTTPNHILLGTDEDGEIEQVITLFAKIRKVYLKKLVIEQIKCIINYVE